MNSQDFEKFDEVSVEKKSGSSEQTMDFHGMFDDEEVLKHRGELANRGYPMKKNMVLGDSRSSRALCKSRRKSQDFPIKEAKAGKVRVLGKLDDTRVKRNE